eukprot:g10526.t1
MATLRSGVELGSQQQKELEADDTNSAEPRPKGSLSVTKPRPRLVVLDLDKTVWPVYCQEQTLGPYTRYCGSDSAVSCSFRYGGRKILRLFPEVVDILRCFEQEEIRLAVASRSPVDEGGSARGILGALGLIDKFCCLEIHRGSKAVHFQDIHAATGIPYRDMLFFDDEKSNITTVSKLGVTCVKLSKEFGLTFEAVNSGLKQYREACLSRASLKDWFTPAPRKDKLEDLGQETESPTDSSVEDPEKDA